MAKKPKVEDQRPPEKRGRNAFKTVGPKESVSQTVSDILTGSVLRDPPAASGEIVRELRYDKLPPDPGRQSDTRSWTEAPPGEAPATSGGMQVGRAVIPPSVRPPKVHPADDPVVFITPEQLPNPEMAIVALLDYTRSTFSTAAMAFGFRYLTPRKERVQVPIGYITDFASIPRPLWGFVPPFGPHARAAILHDWLYVVGQPGKRGFADQVMLDAMRDLGVNPFLRKAIYFGVSWFGGIGYGKRKEWAESWADWRTGKVVPPAHRPEEFYDGKWPDDPAIGRRQD